MQVNDAMVSSEEAPPVWTMKAPSAGSSVHLEEMTLSLPNQTILEREGSQKTSSQDPRNWSQGKKNAQILMVAFHSMMGTFMAAGIIPAYDTLAKEYNVTVPDASYLTSFQVSNLQIVSYVQTEFGDMTNR
jgi:hypothetical protein